MRDDRSQAELDQQFTVFVIRVQGRLLHAGDLLTGDRARADDLVQHALAKAYERWPTISDGAPEAYVRKAMLNHYLDWWRRARPREAPGSAAGHGPQFPDHASAVVRRDAVQRAMVCLTRRERAVVVLRYWFDLSEADIADELGIAPGTVKSTNARALKRLRDNVHLASEDGLAALQATGGHADEGVLR